MALVADMVTAAKAVALAQKYQQQSAAEKAPSPAPSSGDEAVVPHLSSSGFTSELEKHISDYKKGRGELSEKTAGKVQRFDEANSALLQQFSPKALSSYGLYGTFMNYESRARYVSNVYSATKEISTITRSLKSV